MNLDAIYAKWQRAKSALDAEWLAKRPSDWRDRLAWITDWSAAQRELERVRMQEIWG